MSPASPLLRRKAANFVLESDFFGKPHAGALCVEDRGAFLWASWWCLVQIRRLRAHAAGGIGHGWWCCCVLATTQRESPKVVGNCGSYRAGGERRNPQNPTSTQALLPTSTHSNDFCIMRVCIRLSSRQPPSWLARVIKWWAIPIKNLACWIARLLNCYKRFSNLYLRW